MGNGEWKTGRVNPDLSGKIGVAGESPRARLGKRAAGRPVAVLVLGRAPQVIREPLDSLHRTELTDV